MGVSEEDLNAITSVLRTADEVLTQKRRLHMTREGWCENRQKME